MATDSSSEHDQPPSPALVSPRETAVVDGNEVTFVWRPVDEAEAYRVQVATDAAFKSIVYEQDVGIKTALIVTDTFPTSEETFFWRVLARVDDTWSAGERVQSFVSGAPETSAAEDQPGTSSVGPVTQLVRAASSVFSTQSAADAEKDRFDREVEQGVAYEGMAVGQVATVTVTLIVMITVIIVVLFQWTAMEAQTVRSERAGVDHLPVHEEERAAERQLQEFGVIDEAEGIYRIPIDQAIDDIEAEYAEEEREYTRAFTARGR